MRYFRAKERENDENAAFRLYVTKALELTVESVARVRMKDYAEVIKIKPVDNRTGDEIAADIMKRAGLTMAG